MSKADADSVAGKGVEQTEERIDQERRDALNRLAKYTAPVMLAALTSRAAAQGMSLISDTRLKRDTAKIGALADGINLYLYRYRYLWSDTIHVGVMAQEVAEVMPEAVQRGADGYMRVDYARLGLRVQTWDQWTAAHRRQRAHNHRRIAANIASCQRC
jgi:hypothetical protein